jgi:hypothetical protein
MADQLLFDALSRPSRPSNWIMAGTAETAVLELPGNLGIELDSCHLKRVK